MVIKRDIFTPPQKSDASRRVERRVLPTDSSTRRPRNSGPVWRSFRLQIAILDKANREAPLHSDRIDLDRHAEERVEGVVEASHRSARQPNLGDTRQKRLQ